MAEKDRKQYNSDICIGGKRIGVMREIAKGRFQESFLSIEVKMPERVFLLRLEHNINANDLNEFKKEYPLCKVIVYQPIDFSKLKGATK